MSPMSLQAGFLRDVLKTLSDPSANSRSKHLKNYQSIRGALNRQASRIHYAEHIIIKTRTSAHQLLEVREEDDRKSSVPKGGTDNRRWQGNIWCFARGKPCMVGYRFHEG